MEDTKNTKKDGASKQEAIGEILTKLVYGYRGIKETSCKHDIWRSNVMFKLVKLEPKIRALFEERGEALILSPESQEREGFRPYAGFLVNSHYLNTLSQKTDFLYKNERRDAKTLKRGGAGETAKKEVWGDESTARTGKNKSHKIAEDYTGVTDIDFSDIEYQMDKEMLAQHGYGEVVEIKRLVIKALREADKKISRCQNQLSGQTAGELERLFYHKLDGLKPGEILEEENWTTSHLRTKETHWKETIGAIDFGEGVYNPFAADSSSEKKSEKKSAKKR